MANNNLQLDVEYDVVTNALMVLLNQYPAIRNGDKIKFNDLSADYGISMIPISGAVITSQIKDILGHTTQNCQYPFYVIFRTGSLREKQQINAKEFLDKLGRWLEKQPIDSYAMAEYPKLSGTRKFTEIVRTSPATLTDIGDNGVEQWSIAVTARYVNEF